MVPVRREMLCKMQEEEGALSMNLPQQVKACTLVSWASFMTKSATSV